MGFSATPGSKTPEPIGAKLRVRNYVVDPSLTSEYGGIARRIRARAVKGTSLIAYLTQTSTSRDHSHLLPSSFTANIMLVINRTRKDSCGDARVLLRFSYTQFFYALTLQTEAQRREVIHLEGDGSLVVKTEVPRPRPRPASSST